MDYIDEQTGLLPNLSDLMDQMKENAADFQFADYHLSDDVLDDIQKVEADKIAFSSPSYIVFKGTTDKVESVASVDFLKAVYAVPFCQAFHRYQQLLSTDNVKNVVLAVTSTENLEQATAALRQMPLQSLSDNVKVPIVNAVRGILQEDGVEEDKLQTNIDLFLSFLFDDSASGKAVGRGDAIVSPILSGLSLIAVSSNVVVRVVEDMASNQKLYADALKNLGEQMPLHEISSSFVGDNRIISGAPGTGKSWKLLNELYKNNIRGIRVVFHPEYSYYDFVGNYKPVPVYSIKQGNGDYEEVPELVTVSGAPANIPGSPTIDYQFVPGPFTTVLVGALRHPEKQYCLIIEEINRADAAAVFGDIFQLLDRDRKGVSSYGINPSKELRDYLYAQKVLAEGEELKIPANLSIWATMNSADQGVTVLDSAFKRRWNFEYLPINLSQNHQLEMALIDYDNQRHSLSELLTAINKRLQRLQIPEDRLIGQFFISEESLREQNQVPGAFAKILIYLWDDVLRNRRDEFFDLKATPTLASVLEQYPSDDVLQLHLPSSREDGDAVGQEQDEAYANEENADGSMGVEDDNSIIFDSDGTGND